MQIKSLSNKATFSDIVHLDAIINAVGDFLYPNEWSNNPYTAGEQQPFFRVKPKDHAKKLKGQKNTPPQESKVVQQLRYRIENGIPKDSKKTLVLSVAEHLEFTRAVAMFKGVRIKILSLVEDNHLPYTVTLKDGTDIAHKEINKRVWLKKYRKIFCTGYIPIKANGEIRWERMFFPLNAGSEVVKKINNIPAEKLKGFYNKLLPVFADYLEKLAGELKKRQQEYDDLHDQKQGKLQKHPINITQPECYNLLKTLAEEIYSCEFSEKIDFPAVLEKTSDNVKGLLGITKRGSGGISADDRAKRAKDILNRVKAEILAQSSMSSI
jgi:hypothetical protein